MSNVQRSANPFSTSQGSDWFYVGRDDASSEISDQSQRESKKAPPNPAVPVRSMTEAINGPGLLDKNISQPSKVIVSSKTVKSVKMPPPIPRKPAKLSQHASSEAILRTKSKIDSFNGCEMGEVPPARHVQNDNGQTYISNAAGVTASPVSNATKKPPSTNELMDSDAGTRVPSWEPLQPKK